MGSPFCPNVLRSAFGPLCRLPRWEEVAETSRRGAPSSATEAVPLSQPTFPEASSLWDTSESYSIPSCGGCPAPVQVARRRATPCGRPLRQAAAARWGCGKPPAGRAGGRWEGYGRRGGAKRAFVLPIVGRPGSPCAALQPRGTLHERGSGRAVRGGMYAAGGQISRAGR